MSALLEVNDMSAAYEDAGPVLKRVSLSLAAGEMLAIGREIHEPVRAHAVAFGGGDRPGERDRLQGRGAVAAQSLRRERGDRFDVKDRIAHRQESMRWSRGL